MKRQAWGWLMAAVMAAGLNASYHDGGFRWAHQFVSRVQHNSVAVLALATGRADQFLLEAQLIKPRHEERSCRFAAAMTRVQDKVVPAQARSDQFEAISDLMPASEAAQLGRREANRARLEVKIANRMLRGRFDPAVFNPVEFRDLKIQTACPRVHITVPKVSIPVPVVEIDESDSGPI
jgi:hypothetical protein